MPTAGYSGTPLLKKLGIRPELRVLLIDPPADYFQLLEADISRQIFQQPPADLVHIFAVTKNELAASFSSLIKQLPPEAAVWISWYKKSSKIFTDITEDVIRKIVLPAGWVDIKVCAVSNIWSGLKIVQRVSQRKK